MQTATPRVKEETRKHWLIIATVQQKVLLGIPTWKAADV